jgi:hypothetical protein
MSLDELFSRIAEEMPGYLAAAAGSFQAGASFEAHSTGSIDLTEKRDALLQMIRSYNDTYLGLGGSIDLGSNDEILITASRVYLLVKVDHDQQRFIAVMLAASGNIGYLRFRIRDYLRQLR